MKGKDYPFEYIYLWMYGIYEHLLPYYHILEFYEFKFTYYYIIEFSFDQHVLEYYEQICRDIGIVG